MRLPLAVPLQSRDGSVTRDPKTKNAILEVVGEGEGAKLKMRKRPGLTDLGLARVGTAQLLTYWNSAFRTVIGDFMVEATTQVRPTTWNPLDKASTVTLSGGNLTFTHSNLSGSASIVRSVHSISSGQWYFEVAITTLSGLGLGGYIGVANGSAALNPHPNLPATDANAIYLVCIGGAGPAFVRHNNINTNTAVTVSSGATVGVLVDRGASTIKFYKNGVEIYSGALGVTGAVYAATATGSDADFIGTANFSATPPGTASANLSPTTAGLPFSAQDNGSNAFESLLMVKNAQQAWTLDTSDTLTAITDPDYPGQYTVTLTSLTRSGTTATATTAFDTNFQVGSSVTIAGAAQAAYNGAKVITSITPSTTIPATVEQIAITITRSGTTATATTVNKPHGLTNGQQITITGAEQSQYNGVKTITWVSPTQFTFTVTVTGATAASPTSPATGSPGFVAPLFNGFLTNTYAGSPGTTSFQLSVSPWSPAADAAFKVGGSVTISNSNVAGVAGSYTITAKGAAGGALILYFTVGGFATSAFGNCQAQPTVPSITSITAAQIGSSSIAVATVTCSGAHGFTTGEVITITGASQFQYNGQKVITVTGATTFTYSISYTPATSESPATPATGNITFARDVPPQVIGAKFTFEVAGAPATPATGATITASGGRTTVPGIAYLDGYFCVMDEQGVIYNSPEDDPSSWEPLEYLTALNETGAGVAIAKHLNTVVAFKEWSTEFFYNAGSADALDVGSPLRPVENQHTLVGCAQGWSVADVAGSLLWIAQEKRQKGRSVYIMQGAQQARVSSADVDRILDADDLSEVHAYGVKIGGHRLYVLTLEDSGITLVYDLDSKVWGEWSSYTVNGSSVSVSSITRSGAIATVTFGAAHGLSDGDPVLIAGAAQAQYNGIFEAFRVSATVIQIEVSGSPATPATGTITGAGYAESYFKFPYYATGEGLDVVLHESDGHLYKIDPSVYLDAAVPVNVHARSSRLDGGTTARKSMPRIAVIGDSVNSFAVIRWSDDDCATFSAYRKVDLSNEEPEIRRCGSFKRRTIEVRHIANTALQLEALEL